MSWKAAPEGIEFTMMMPGGGVTVKVTTTAWVLFVAPPELTFTCPLYVPAGNPCATETLTVGLVLVFPVIGMADSHVPPEGTVEGLTVKLIGAPMLETFTFCD